MNPADNLFAAAQPQDQPRTSSGLRRYSQIACQVLEERKECTVEELSEEVRRQLREVHGEHHAKEEHDQLKLSVEQKEKQLHDLKMKSMAYKSLLKTNEKLGDEDRQCNAIKMPFVIVRTKMESAVNCHVSQDRCHYLFNFENMFEILDNMEILGKMELPETSEDRE